MNYLQYFIFNVLYSIFYILIFSIFYKKNLIIDIPKINKMIIKNDDNVDASLQEFFKQEHSFQYISFS